MAARPVGILLFQFFGRKGENANRLSQDLRLFSRGIQFMQIIIHPYQGIEIPGKGRILFGMTRQQVRSFFSEEPMEILINKTDAFPKDVY